MDMQPVHPQTLQLQRSPPARSNNKFDSDAPVKKFDLHIEALAAFVRKFSGLDKKAQEAMDAVGNYAQTMSS